MMTVKQNIEGFEKFDSMLRGINMFSGCQLYDQGNRRKHLRSMARGSNQQMNLKTVCRPDFKI